MKTTRTTILKLLVVAGLGSRRKMADAIRNQKVRKNGVVIESFLEPVNPLKDIILYDGIRLKPVPEKTIYLMMNKPKGLLSTTEDELGRRTVMDIIPEKYRSWRLYPVGRLDKDTTGLLLFTNDGSFTHHLTHPSFELEKEYLVQLDGKLTVAELNKLAHGIKLEDGTTSPAVIRALKQNLPYNYSLTIHEGKKRQIRRMFAALGYGIVALKRIRTGKLQLGNLREGEIRQLTKAEVTILTQR